MQFMAQRGDGGCGRRFWHRGAPRESCGLAVDPRCREAPQRCYWHCGCQDVAEEKRRSDRLAARLEGAVSDGTYLEGADLRGANLEQAKLPSAQLPGAFMSGVRLQKAILRQANLEDAVIQDANLCGANLVRANLRRARLEGSCLDEADLKEARMTEVGLQGAFLRRAYLEDADLARGTMTFANLEDAHLWRARLPGASLTSASLQRADLRRARLDGAGLLGAILDGASLAEIRLDGWSACETTVWGTPKEEVTGSWREAAGVFYSLRRHYSDTGDHRRADEFYIRELRCRHLAQGAWMRGTVWALHRLLWGYGAMPWLLCAWMILLVTLFGLLLFPWVGITSSQPSLVPAWDAVSHDAIQGLALSLVTFATLGYGNRYPASELGEVLAGIESILAMLLVSMFVVSLTRKYSRW